MNELNALIRVCRTPFREVLSIIAILPLLLLTKKKTKYKSKRIIVTQPIHKLIGINLLFIQIVVIIHVSLFVILTNMMRQN